MATVQNNQSLLDVAVWNDGTALNAFEWAFANNMSMTDGLAPKQFLIVPTQNVNNVAKQDIANFFKFNNHIPATAISLTQAVSPIGIGTMIIGNNFLVAAP